MQKKQRSKQRSKKMTAEQQSALFVKTAKELEADEREGSFDSALKAILPVNRGTQKTKAKPGPQGA